MMIRCIVVDDEPLAADLVAGYLAKSPGFECVAVFSTAMDAFVFLQNNKVDLIFLDIEMPGLTGLGFIRALKNPPAVIFVTAYANFAVDAFEIAAIDYLVKPVTYERFQRALHRVNGEPQTTLTPTSIDHIFLKINRKLLRIELTSLLFVEGAGDYCKLHLSAQTLLTYMTMAKLAEMLPADRFTRIHRSTIVQTALIEYIEGNVLKLGEHRLTIGYTYREEILEKLRK